MIESQIERWLGQQLVSLKCLYLKFISPGNDGVPDRIVIIPGGHLLFVELKADDGRLSPLQYYQAHQLLQASCDVRIVRGMKEAQQLVEDIKIIMEARNAI